MIKNSSLGKKIQFAMLTVVIAMLLLALVIFAFTMSSLSRSQTQASREMSSATEQMSSDYMSGQTTALLQDMAVEKAEIANAVFSGFKRAVCEAAYAAEKIYNEPENYSPRQVPLPDPESDGELTLQVLFSAATDPEDPAVRAELELIGNVQDTLMAINSNQELMVSNYVASESGFVVMADHIPAAKYDDAGRLMPFEAGERPWYRGAKALGAPYFTPVTKDAHSTHLAVMCGVPVYKDGKLKAVAGAGMYLDEMEALVRSINVGENGSACIMTGYGQIVFSTAEEGVFAARVGGEDLRKSEDPDLARIAGDAAIGCKGVSEIDIDGVPSYIAYAPMNAVGWTMFLMLPKEEVEAPTAQLLESLGMMSARSLESSSEQINRATWMMLALFCAAVAAAALISVKLSKDIVKPISLLTDKVSAIKGDTLDFTWDLDTGDETQTLAESFGSMTRRMNDYIADIQTITAEKERIGTELDLAKRIQEAMLPNIFPPFPERGEFDIYASMVPAKEVGGDFYDFFFVDDDHLCLVIADVSGKGIGAALFMTICKITIKNFAGQGMKPSEVLRKTNDMICANNPADMFVTVWVGILEISTGKLTASNAGHEYPALMKPGKGYEIVKDPHGFVVGGFEDEVYEDYELVLEPGSRLFLYTDGLAEAKGKGGAADMFGLERITSALNSAPEADAKQTLDNMDLAVADFVKDAEQFDDLTMLCLEYNGSGHREDPISVK
ncbi:MAG: SpoIIE family protein phosphatase [Firmicutes bacterium]|nr:SpoIIE family protein phosphatase [Bacillota bacterium]